jgi:hypothetical protein
MRMSGRIRPDAFRCRRMIPTVSAAPRTSSTVAPEGTRTISATANRRSEGAAHRPGCVDNNVFSLTAPDRAGPVRDRLVGYLFEKMRLNPEWEATIIGDGGRPSRGNCGVCAMTLDEFEDVLKQLTPGQGAHVMTAGRSCSAITRAVGSSERDNPASEAAPACRLKGGASQRTTTRCRPLVSKIAGKQPNHPPLSGCLRNGPRRDKGSEPGHWRNVCLCQERTLAIPRSIQQASSTRVSRLPAPLIWSLCDEARRAAGISRREPRF